MVRGLQQTQDWHKGGLLTKKKQEKQKTLTSRRYAFIGNISFAKPPTFIVSLYIELVKRFEDVFQRVRDSKFLPLEKIQKNI